MCTKPLLALVFLALAAGAQEPQKEFYESGKLKAEFSVDAQGRKQGKYVEYYESGKKKVAGAYDQGLPHGEWWEYYESGRPFGKKGFDKGKPAGGIVRMDQNGVVLYRATMTQGRPQIYRDFKRLEPAYPRSLEEIRKQIEIIDPVAQRLDVSEAGKFDIEPSSTVPYRAGKLKGAYLKDALKHFNVYRYLSGVTHSIKLDEGYNDESQHAAVVVDAHGSLTHTPPRRDDMDSGFHAKGFKGAKSSNLHRGQGQLRRSIDGWMEDPGENNLKAAGHRAWCQNPAMGRVGFGECGSTFAQWAHDGSGRAEAPELIGYPFPGYHPTEYFGTRGPWSICPKETRFKIPAQADLGVRVWLLDEGFDFTQELEIDSKAVTSDYGSGQRAVFRPVVPSDVKLENQRVWVLVLKGAQPLFGYFVHFVPLAPEAGDDPASSGETSKRSRLARQEKVQTAEEFYRAVEKKYLSAETLRWKQSFKTEISVEGLPGKLTSEYKVEVELKKGNKVRIDMGENSIRSDGLDRATPKDFEESVRLLFLRTGFRMDALNHAKVGDLEPAKNCKVGGFTWGKPVKIDGKELKCVEFTVTVTLEGKKDTHKNSFWIDPATLHIRRTHRDNGEGWSATEEYGEIDMNRPIDDSRFAPPDEKK